MTKAILITASPRLATTAAPVTLRMAGGGQKPYVHGGNHYRAGVTQMLRLGARIEWGDEGWTGGVVPSTGSLAWAPSTKADLATFSAYYWRNAAITVDEVDEDTGVITNRLTGKVADAVPQDDKLLITIVDLAAGLGRPVVTARFAGTGGIEGGTEAAGRIKRRTWGRTFNVEGHVFDKANNIYEFGDNAYPWQSFDVIRDGGRDATPAPTVVAWQGSIAATLAALVASSPVQGSGVAAPSIAKVKWWTQARGPLTADVRGEIGTGYVETVPEIAARILAAVGGPSVTNASTAAGWRPGVAGIHIDEGEDINVALTRLTMGVSLLWILNAAAGTITFREFTFSSPVASLVSDDVSRERTLPPMKTRRVGYQRSYRIHSDGDIVVTLLQSDPAAGTKLDGIAAGATKNPIVVSDTEPPAPAEGLLWVQTGGTYVIFKLRSGNAWVTGANALSAYNALTGKPIALADINTTEASKLSGIAYGATTGRNRILNPGGEDGTVDPWITDLVTGGSFSFTANTTNPASGKYRLLLSKSATGQGIGKVHPAIATSEGKAWLYRITIWGNGSSSASGIYVRMNERSSAPAGGYVTPALKTRESDMVGNGPCPATPTTYTYVYITPPNVTFFSPAFFNWTNAPLEVAFDDIEVYELTDYELGADVTADHQHTLTVAPAQAVQYDYTGSTSAQLPKILQNTMKKAGTDVTSSTAFTYTGNGCTVTTTGLSAGQVRLTGVSASSAYITVTAQVSGGAPQIDNIPVTRTVGDPPAASGGGSAATGFGPVDVNVSISDTSYDGSPQVLASAQMLPNSSGQMRLVLNADYFADHGLTAALIAKAQRSTDNSTWTDAGLAASGSTATGGYYNTPPGQPVGFDDWVEGTPGTVAANGIITGMTVGVAYYVRWIAYKSGSQASVGVFGTASGAQS